MRHAHEEPAVQIVNAGRRTVLASLVVMLALALGALAPAVAGASAGLALTSEFPASVAIGATGVPGAVTVTNSNSPDQGSSTVCNAGEIGSCAGSQGFTLVPSCGATDVMGCTALGVDPGVFVLSATATGDPASACPNMQFTVTQVDAVSGKVRFTPTSGNIVLPTPGSICRIMFTFSVARSPVSDARPQPGRQTLQIVEAAAVSSLGDTAFNRASGATTVTPGPPTLIDTDPDSPANDNTPEVKGTAPADVATVSLYTNAACSGAHIGQGTTATFTSPGLTITVPDDSSTTIWAAGTDTDGGTTPCSPVSITYVEDSTPPAAPSLSDVDPDSPANDNSPRIKGTAAAGATVRLYTNAACTSAVAGQGSAAAFASPGLTAPVADDTTTTFHATATDTAGNASACSATSISYVEDSTAPAAPTAASTNPASPSSDNTPLVVGSAAPSTTVRIYTTAGCTPPTAGQGSAATFAATGIEISVPSDSTSTLYATATDTANNTSACAPLGMTYVEDSTAPAAPEIAASNPTSPGADNSPRLRGSAEAGSTVRIYTDATCSSAPAAEGGAAAFSSPGLQVTVADNSSSTFYARAIDAAGNVSACSPSGRGYVEDSVAPQIVVGDGPTGNPPTFTFSSPEAGAHFECRIDSGPFVPCTSPHTPTGLAVGVHTFQVRAIDAAGNVGPASAGRSFTITGVTPPPATKAPAQPGCTTIKGTLYLGTAARNIRNGSSKTDIMFGLGGNDVLRGAGGLDCLYGGAGADLLRGGSGADRLFGGTGNDRVEGLSGNDQVNGQSGNDRLVGGTGHDTITGGAGLDRLIDRSGRDRLSGGAGHDRIDARDSKPADRRRIDRITCGAGRDTVLADPRDRVARDCERVTKRSIGAPARRTY